MAGGAGESEAGDEAGIRSFAALAARADPPLDELALSMAVALRGAGAEAVRGALERLDALGAEVAAERGSGTDPAAAARACAEVLGARHGFAGDAEHYDDPANSMLDLVLERRRGLPIALSVVYVEVARRAGVALAGVGLPGHYVVGHFGASPPLLLDPFAGGAPVEGEPPPEHVRPWGAHETALRMLNNLVGAYQRRGDVGAAIAAAAMRLELPLHRRLRDALETDLRRIRSRLN
jgi:regulator of sirC expression with transglutaminase-like and TPR domain